jgi:hypothetical protein
MSARRGCLFCGNPRGESSILGVVAVDDEAGWAEEATVHAPWCEWLVTRSHQRPVPAGAVVRIVGLPAGLSPWYTGTGR